LSGFELIHYLDLTGSETNPVYPGGCRFDVLINKEKASSLTQAGLYWSSFGLNRMILELQPPILSRL
jgi:hypothetical protein